MALKYKMFGEDLPNTVDSSKLLKQARLTWMEAKMFEALVSSKVDIKGAQSIIEDVVKGFKKAKITAGELNQTVWSNCQRVGKSLPLQ